MDNYIQWLKYKIGGGGSLSISGPLRDPADISRCIVDANWAPDLSTVKFLGPGSLIRQVPAYFNHWLASTGTKNMLVAQTYPGVSKRQQKWVDEFFASLSEQRNELKLSRYCIQI